MKPDVFFGLESAAWPALLLDTRGRVQRANPAAAGVFGAAISSAAADLSAIWPAENGVPSDQFFTRWQQSPAPTVDLKLRTAAGGTVMFTAAVCPFVSEGQNWFVLQLLPFVKPAAAPAPVPVPVALETAPAVLPAETRPAVDAGGILLKQKLDCALQLARTVSLDFNNALTSVLGHASLLLGKAEAGHPWRHSLLEVEKSAARAAEIANDLAVFSRQEKETRRTPPGNLNLVMNRCVDFFRNAQGEKIVWKVQPERDLFGARFDEAKVQQALTKVLENSVEAVSAGGNGQITVQSRNVELSEPTQDRNVRLAAGAYICVEIGDNGAGIDPEILPRIFEPFFSTKGGSHRGLGLALVYGIISNHGGGVAVSSQPGAGASVRIYLPAEKGLFRDGPGGDEDLHGTASILVVDDESLILTMAEAILTEYGYRVLTAGSGQKALALLSREDTKVDLVVTDMVMPAMSGRELAERIRQLMPEAKILCTSGYVMPSDRQAGTAYLQKPFTSRELLAKVKQLLGSALAVD
ncbi:MAG: ATP-binding protein [Verrucomicrobiales bacterium]|nr:ATP-binding protein [Verrucomicrobiales bacterium]